MPRRIGPRDFQRLGGNVGRINLRRRQLLGQRNRNRPRARPDIDDLVWGGHSCPPLLTSAGTTRPRQFQHRLHHMLGLRTRHQNRWRHDQIQPPELLMPGDVLRRNARRPPRQSFVVSLHFVGGELSLRMCIEIRPIAIEREHDEQFGVHARRTERSRQSAAPPPHSKPDEVARPYFTTVTGELQR